jgi:hypothetical protein
MLCRGEFFAVTVIPLFAYLRSIVYTPAMNFVRVGFGVLALRRIASGAVSV